MIKRSMTGGTAATSAPVTRPDAVHKVPAEKRSPPALDVGPDLPVDETARRAMIAQAAYFRAERRDFRGGGELDDWLQAELEIKRMLEG